jgi:hypothetical protein
MYDYLLTEELARERDKEVQRFRREARRIAEAERAHQSTNPAPHFGRIGYVLRLAVEAASRVL